MTTEIAQECGGLMLTRKGETMADDKRNDDPVPVRKPDRAPGKQPIGPGGSPTAPPKK